MARQPAPSGEWETYIEDVQGKSAAFCIDLSWAEEAPPAEKTCLWEVTVGLLQPRKDGLERDDEAGTLENMGDALEAAMAERWAAEMVGWVTRDGWREFYFYLPTPSSSETCLNTIRKTISGFPGYSFHWRAEQDPEWQIYYSFLYPAPEQLRWIHDRSGVRNLDQQGDIASEPRPIRHWLHFATEEGRDIFSAQAEQEGFQLASAYEDFSSDLPYWLEIVREDRATLTTINAVTRRLSQFALHHVGEYDGWACKPVKWYHCIFRRRGPDGSGN